MSFDKELTKLGYVFDPHFRTFQRPEFMGIGYSDGVETEQSVFDAVASCSDVSILSPELLAHDQTWPLRYHLNPNRANLLRPLAHHFTGRVLEIGAGCGAITRFLGEMTKADVLALEGSPMRAKIAAERTRDLDNVTVMVEDVWQLPASIKFDVVTLIGVLEYSPVYTDAENPFEHMLTHVRKLLKPSGILIVAIENKLGLKYLAGSPEDHHGKPMYGVEGRYSAGEATTFGHEELVTLLREHGFPDTETYAPLPDYKLVRSVVSQVGMAHSVFNPTDLVTAATRADNNFSLNPSFDVGQTFRQFHSNGLGLDVSNSFLVIASRKHAHEKVSLAWHYSVERDPLFCKQTEFVAGAKGVEARGRRLASSAPAHGPVTVEGLTQDVAKKTPYVTGHTLADPIYRVLGTDNWSVIELAASFQPYFDALIDEVRATTRASLKWNSDSSIPGAFIDAVPQNFIRDERGRVTLIDKEWVASEAITLGFLIYRSFFATVNAAPRVGLCSEDPLLTRDELVRQLFVVLDLSVSDKELRDWAERERRWQSLVRGRELTSWSHRGDNLVAGVITPALIEAQVEATFTRTRSWRITAPYRRFANVLRRMRDGRS